MNDSKTTLIDLKALIEAFVSEREWQSFHTPKNLSMAIAAEAAELMEKFLWIDSQASYDELETNRQEIEDELADVLIVCLCFANRTNIDIAKAIASKLEEVKAKYPVDKVKGKYHKYTTYVDNEQKKK
jgi:NTP pyrophosphatase (non-canonical NTP hydrolase)